MKENIINPQIMVRWEEVVEDLASEFKGFDKALSKQKAKQREKQPQISKEEAVRRLNLLEGHETVGLDGSLLKPAIICVDIDTADIGRRFKDILDKIGYNSTEFELVFGKPLIVETPSLNHFHLYYKLENVNHQLESEESGELKRFKTTTTSRLGFQCEYGLCQITLGGPGYKLAAGIPLSKVSNIPFSLYPYNYVRQPLKTYLVELNGSHLRSGLRNDHFYKFFIRDNFSFSHTNMSNLLCCEPPLEQKEVKSLSNLNDRDKPITPELLEDQERDLNEKSQAFNVFSFRLPSLAGDKPANVRLRPNETFPRTSYQKLISEGSLRRDTAQSLIQLGFNADRVKAARLAKRTVEATILYIALMEHQLDTFIDDFLWIGESIIGAVSIFLLKKGLLNVMFIESENAFYAYKDNFWQIINESSLSEVVTSTSQRICKFQNVGDKKDHQPIVTIIKEHNSYLTWPTRVTGYNFLNGSLILQDQIVTFVKHDPAHHFNKLIKINYNERKCLTPYEARFLLDLAGEQLYLVNIFRLILFFCLASGGNQVAAFLTGEPGGAKSTFLNLIEKLVAGCCSITHVNSVSSRFNLLDTVRGTNVLFLNDLGSIGMNEESQGIYKKIITEDPLTDEIRYKGAFTFKAKAFLIITTNFEPQDFEMFREPAMADRLMVTPVPSIETVHRINDFIERLAYESENFSGLAIWSLNMFSEFPNTINRATDLNNIISPAKTLIDEFIIERTVYSPDSFMSTTDLVASFNAYVQEMNQSGTTKGFKDIGETTNRKMPKQLRDFAMRASLETPLVEGRSAQAKGFKNIKLKTLQNSANNNTREFTLKANNKLTQLLNLDPFKYHGILMRDNFSVYHQGHVTSTNVELATKISVKAVLDVSSKMVMEGGNFPDYKPHEHIIITRGTPGPKVQDLEVWQQVPTVRLPILTPGKPQELAKEILNTTAKVLEAPDIPSASLDSPNRPINGTTQEELKPEGPLAREAVVKGEAKELEESSIREPKQVKNKTKTKEVHKLDLSLEEKQVCENYNLNEWQAFNQVLTLNVETNKETVPAFKECFNQARSGLLQCATQIEDQISKTPLRAYTSFTKVYDSWEQISTAREFFINFPLYGPIRLIEKLNQSFLNPTTRAFEAVSKRRELDKSNYFARSLPGSNTKPKSMKEFQTSLSNIPDSITNNLDSAYKYPTWNGQSLFPILYKKGDKSYGRLRYIPASNVSTYKADLKRNILRVATKYTHLNFVELDMRAAHTLVFKALSTMSPGEKAKFPSVDEQWSYLVTTFKNLLKSISFKDSEQAVKVVSNWSDNQVKGLIKTQWYKALNAGSIFNPSSTLASNKNKLSLTEDLVIPVSKICQTIFEKIDLFVSLRAFQNQVNENKYIYLPTQQDPFDTTTPSKAQEFEKSEGEVSKLSKKGRTGMSRIFSASEFALILLVFLAISKMNNVMPLSYEADGLLLVGYFQNEESLLQEINQLFKPLAHSFLDEEFGLEFKNLTQFEFD